MSKTSNLFRNQKTPTQRVFFGLFIDLELFQEKHFVTALHGFYE